MNDTTIDVIVESAWEPKHRGSQAKDVRERRKMSSKTYALIAAGSVIGAVFGALLGFWAPELAVSIGFIGTIFVTILKFIMIPLAVAAIMTGLMNFGDLTKGRRIGTKTLAYFGVTTVIAVLIGLAAVGIFQPGATGSQNAEGQFSFSQNRAPGTVGDLLNNLLPTSVPSGIAGENYFGLIVLALLFAGAFLALGVDNRSVVFRFFQAFLDGSRKLVSFILYAAPIGILAITASAVAQNSGSWQQVVGPLSGLTLVVIGGLLFHAVIILPLALKLFGKQSIGRYFSNMIPALFTGMGTASSAASLPVSYEAVVGNNKINERSAAIVMPLGHSINLNGTALYAAAACLFVGQLYGVELSVGSYLLIGFGSILVSLATGGMPGAVPLSLAVVFGMAGFPTEAYAGIGLLLSVDWLFDRLRTPISVWGNAVGAAVIADAFEFKTARQAPRIDPPRPLMRGRGRTDRGGASHGRPGDRRHQESDHRSTRVERRNPDSRSGDRHGRGGSSDRSRGGRRPEPSHSRPGNRPSRGTKPAERSPFEITEEKPPDFLMQSTPTGTGPTTNMPRPPEKPSRAKSEEHPTSPKKTTRKTPERKPRPRVVAAGIEPVVTPDKIEPTPEREPVATTATAPTPVVEPKPKPGSATSAVPYKPLETSQEPVERPEMPRVPKMPTNASAKNNAKALVEETNPVSTPNAGEVVEEPKAKKTPTPEVEPIPADVSEAKSTDAPKPRTRKKKATEKEDKPAVAFGRKPSRKGPPPSDKKKSAPPENAKAEVVAEPSIPAENLTFGRGPKKRPSR